MEASLLAHALDGQLLGPVVDVDVVVDDDDDDDDDVDVDDDDIDRGEDGDVETQHIQSVQDERRGRHVQVVPEAGDAPEAAAAAAAAAASPQPPQQAAREARRRQTITFEQRRALRQKHAQDPNLKQRALGAWFSQRYGHAINQSSVSDSLSDRYAFLDAPPEDPSSRSRSHHHLGRARLARSDHPLLEARLFEWQQLQQAQRLPVSGPLIKAAAERIWASLTHQAGERDFKFSNGWLEGYKKRHGLLKRRHQDPEHPEAAPSPRPAKRPSLSARLHGRVAVVVGSSSGLGRAVALRYAAEGARVVCADLQPALLLPSPGEAGATHDLLQRTHGQDSAIFVPCHVSDEAGVKNLVETAVQWAGRIDIMLNSVGDVESEIQRDTPPLRLHEMPVAMFDHGLAAALRSTMLGCKYALSQMLQQNPLPPNSRGDCIRGCIVNVVGAAASAAPQAASVSHTASKKAIVGLTKQLALDYAKDHVYCNAILPEHVQVASAASTSLHEDAYNAPSVGHPWGSVGRVDDVAKTAVFLASDDASWVNGQALVVDGGFAANA